MKKILMTLALGAGIAFAGQTADKDDLLALATAGQVNGEAMELKQGEMDDVKAGYYYSRYVRYYRSPSSRYYRGTSRSYIYARAFWGR